MIGTALHNRYRIDAELGWGGMGVVYRAHDTLLDRPVAVKVLSDPGLGTEGRARLLREARAAAKLDHPNIVAVYDAGEADGTSFIVMQLVEGESLYQRRPQAVPEILSIARQICIALEHAHASGIIHRDLKLENVVVTQGQTVKLMDFGLARSVESRLTSEGTIVGTFSYLAPELILGQPASPQSDLYALGVMLYELTTGQPPFSGETLVALLSQHLHATLVPPSTHNPAIPAALETLILRLLNKQPNERPASAAEAREALEQLDLTTPTTVETRHGAPLLDRIVRGRLVARERELAEANALWQKAVGGESGVLLVSGEPGIGKTRLVRELITFAELSRATALLGECYAEGGAPYAPIAQIIQSTDLTGLADLSGLVLADLITLAPALRARFPDALPNPPLDPQAEQQRLFESVVAFCAALASRAPLLLVVDDAHWADGGTLALTHHLARRAPKLKLKLLLVLTYREVELAESRALNDALADLNRERLATRLKLARFTRDQTRDLLAAMFAEDITPEFLDGIYHETEGNPFFVEEVCKALIEEGQIYREDGRWRRPPSMSEMRVPQSVRVAIETRVSKLPEAAQETLRLCAVLGRKFDFETLQTASEQAEDTLIDLLEGAEKAQLIGEVGRAGGGTFAFTHALIPATLVESVSGLRRRRMHRSAAQAIERLHPDDYAALAYHCAQAADDERALAFYIKAADRARKVYANDDAIRFYAEALALTPNDTPERFDLLAARAKVYDVVARREPQRADIDAMLVLAEELKDDFRQCDALLALADYYGLTEVGRTDEAAQRAIALARRLRDRAREGRALRIAGWAAWLMGKWAESRSLLEASVACFREADLPHELAASLSQLSLALRSLDEFSAARAMLDEVVALCRQSGDQSQEGTALRRLAFLHLVQNNDGEAAQPLAQAALALHQATGNRSEEAASHNTLAVAHEALKEFDLAEQHEWHHLEISEATGSNSGIAAAVLELAALLFERGDYASALRLVEEHWRRAQHSGDDFFANQMTWPKLYVLLPLGQYEHCLKLVKAYAAFARKALGEGWYGSALGLEVFARAELGDYSGAQETLAQMWETVTHASVSAHSRAEALGWRAYLGWLENTADSLRAGLEDAAQANVLVAGASATAWPRWIIAHLFSARIHLLLGAPEAALVASAEALRVRMTYPRAVSTFVYGRYRVD